MKTEQRTPPLFRPRKPVSQSPGRAGGPLAQPNRWPTSVIRVTDAKRKRQKTHSLIFPNAILGKVSSGKSAGFYPRLHRNLQPSVYCSSAGGTHVALHLRAEKRYPRGRNRSADAQYVAKPVRVLDPHHGSVTRRTPHPAFALLAHSPQPTTFGTTVQGKPPSRHSLGRTVRTLGTPKNQQ